MTADAKGKLSDAAVSDEALRELTAITKIAPNKETCFHKHVRAAVSEIWALHVSVRGLTQNVGEPRWPQISRAFAFTTGFHSDTWPSKRLQKHTYKAVERMRARTPGADRRQNGRGPL